MFFIRELGLSVIFGLLTGTLAIVGVAIADVTPASPSDPLDVFTRWGVIGALVFAQALYLKDVRIVRESNAAQLTKLNSEYIKQTAQLNNDYIKHTQELHQEHSSQMTAINTERAEERRSYLQLMAAENALNRHAHAEMLESIINEVKATGKDMRDISMVHSQQRQEAVGAIVDEVRREIEKSNNKVH